MAAATQHDGGKEENARRRGTASIFGSSSSCTAAVPAPLLHPSLFIAQKEDHGQLCSHCSLCISLVMNKQNAFLIHAYEVLDETSSRASLEIEALICGSRPAAWPCLTTRSALSMAASICGK